MFDCFKKRSKPSETSSTPSPLRYAALPPENDAIRLLTLEPAPGEYFWRTLTGTLHVATFSSKPQYIALSYTWGDSYLNDRRLPVTQGNATSTTITINDQRVPIQHNLALALLHLRSSTHKICLWIDSICINQQDTSERNSQVAMMTFIYRRALTVVAWLGIGRYKDKTPDMTYTAGAVAVGNMAQEWRKGVSRHLAYSIAKAEGHRTTDEPIQPVELAQIANSKYWSRLWVVQELCIARDVLVMKGPDIWDWRSVQHWKRPSLQMPSPHGAMEQLIRARSSRFGPDRQLKVLVERFKSNGCTETRDRVFGVLGMATDVWPAPGFEGLDDWMIEAGGVSRHNAYLSFRANGKKVFLVNYKRPFYDIWIDTLRFALDEMSAPQEQLEGSTPRDIYSVRAAGIIQEALNHQVEREMVNLHESATEPSRILCFGFVISKIIRIGPTYRSLVGSSDVQKLWTSAWEQEYTNPTDQEHLREFEEAYIHEILNLTDDQLSRVRDIRRPETVAWPCHIGNDPDILATAETFKETYNQLPQPSTPNTAKSPILVLGTNQVFALAPPSAQVRDCIVQFKDSDASVMMRPVGTADGFVLLGRVATARKENLEDCQQLYVQLNLRTLQAISSHIETY